MAFGIGDGLRIAAPIVGGLLGITNEQHQDERQIRQQQRLTDMQSGANEAAANRSMQRQLDMWNKTNYGAQIGHMKEAGLNPALMYGLSGGGGATTGGGTEAGVSGGQAANSAATTQNKIAMGIQAAQTALIAAQTEKTMAETKNLEATTGKTGVETEAGKIDLKTKEVTQGETIERIIAEAAKANSEAATAWRDNQIGDQTAQDKIKTIQQAAIESVLNNTKTSKEIRIKEAEAAIQEFEAEATKNGVSTKAPWYIKLMSNLYDKIDVLNKMEEGGR